MKILALSDHESKYLWDFFEKEKLDGIDLIISCGDLSPQYLSFLATFAHAPLLYVHGNHDECYEKTPPEGCICIEDSIYCYKGVRILGLGGSLRYREGKHQFTQTAMKRRVRRLWLKLLYHRGFDILVTHAPAYDLNDGEDRAHTGFQAFNRLLERYRPGYFIHGHIHPTYGGKYKRSFEYNGITVLNAYDRIEIEYQ